MHLDIYTLIYAVIAVLLLGRLWWVFGTRNEDEPQRPNPFTPPAPVETPAATAPVLQQPVARLLPAGPPPNSLAGGLAQVKLIEPAFDEKTFLQERRDVFGTIVAAFAAGNLNSIEEFLSPAVLTQFQNAVNARAQAGQKAETRIARIKEAEVTAARADGTQAFLTVKFVSIQENILRNAGGTIIGGTEGKFEEVTDIWTFAHDTQTPNSKWIVVETRG